MGCYRWKCCCGASKSAETSWAHPRDSGRKGYADVVVVAAVAAVAVVVV